MKIKNAKLGDFTIEDMLLDLINIYNKTDVGDEGLEMKNKCEKYLEMLEWMKK
jgi:hypothetical protein